MKSVKSKILLGMTTAAMLVCFSFGATACKKDKGGDKEKLSTPTNIVIVQETATVTWEEVEGAVEYTVKINSDETTVVSETTYVLTTDTSKLKDGDNTVSVKANATDNNDASDYSTTVTYVYDATPAFATPAAPTVSGREVSWAAVEGAEGYTVKIGEKEYPAESNSFDIETIMDELVDKTGYEISVKVNATSAHKASAYSEAASYTHVLTAQEAAASFIKSVNAIDETVTADSKAEIELARQKYDALSDEAKEENGVDEAITKLAGKECDYFAVLVDAIEVDELDKTITKEEKEAVDAAIETATTYYENLIDPTGAEATNTAYGEKKSAYNTLITAIEGDVEAIEDVIEELNLTGEITQTGKELLEYYETLNTIQTNIDGLVGYAASILDSELAAKLATEIEEVLKVPYATEDSVEAFINGANGTVTILYKAVNVIGEPLNGDAPTLSVAIYDAANVAAADAGEATEPTVESTAATFVNNNGVYYYTTSFTKIGNIKDAVMEEDNVTVKEPAVLPKYRLKVIYTIGDGEATEVKYAEFDDDIYFNGGDNNYNAIYADGTIKFSGADNTAFFDIYLASDIQRGTGIPVIKGFPLVSGVSVKNGITVDEFRKQLARDEEYSKVLLDKTYEVRFVVYNKAENGGIVMSNIKTDLVSNDTYTLDLTAEDAKERIHLGDAGTVIGTDGGITIGAAWTTADYDDKGVSKPGLVSQFNDAANVTADNVHTFLAYKVYVTLKGETKYFTVDCVNGGNISASVMQTEIFKLFNNTTDNSYKIGLQLILREKAAETYGSILRESEIREYDWNVKLTLPDNTCQVRFSGHDYFEFLRVGDNGSVFNFGVECVEVKVEKGGESYSAYLYNAGGSKNNSTLLALYATKAMDEELEINGTGGAGTALDCDTVSNGWCFTSNFNTWAINNLGAAAGFDVTDGWEISTKVHFDGDYGVTSKYSDPIKYVA